MPKGKGKGATPKFTVTQICQALDSTRGMITLAADRLRCSPSTIYNYIDRHPRIQELIDAHNERMVDKAEYNLTDKIEEGDLGAIKYVLSTKGKKRGYGEEMKHDVTHHDERGNVRTRVEILLSETEERMNANGYIRDRQSDGRDT